MNIFKLIAIVIILNSIVRIAYCVHRAHFQNIINYVFAPMVGRRAPLVWSPRGSLERGMVCN